MSFSDPSALEQCPYDKTHMIQKKRMPYHLKKCREQHPEKVLKICQFNSRHEVPAEQYEHHLLNCENRHVVASSLHALASLGPDAMPSMSSSPSPSPSLNDENWDREENGRGLDQSPAISMGFSALSSGFEPTQQPSLEQVADPKMEAILSPDRFGFYHPRVQDMQQRGLLPEAEPTERRRQGGRGRGVFKPASGLAPSTSFGRGQWRSHMSTEQGESRVGHGDSAERGRPFCAPTSYQEALKINAMKALNNL